MRVGDRKKPESTNMVQISCPSATKDTYNTSLTSLRQHKNLLLALLDGLGGIKEQHNKMYYIKREFLG